ERAPAGPTIPYHYSIRPEVTMYALKAMYPDRAGADDWAQVLAEFPLFSGISSRRLRKLAREGTVLEFAPGDEVVVRGGPGDSLYIILGGAAKASGKPGARTLGTGDYFGELAFLGG